MKTKQLLIVIIFSMISFGVCAQKKGLSKEFKKSTISELSKLLNENYVFPEIAKKIEGRLKMKLTSGFFNQYENIDSFAVAISKEIKYFNQDKHLLVWPSNQNEEIDTTDKNLDNLPFDYMRSRYWIKGFIEAKKMLKNIGYLNFCIFDPVKEASPIADSYMNLLSTSDAMIIDLRENKGGDPHMVQYLLSYFFDKKVQLNSVYWRFTNQTEEYWTIDTIKGKKLPDIPVFILTSKQTESGAEAFCYDMKAHKRATLIGETTSGAANPGGQFNINEKLIVFIPTGQVTNPVTKTNWEGTGVEPDIKTTAEESYNKAIEIAGPLAIEVRKKKEVIHRILINELKTSLSPFNRANTHANAEDQVYQVLKKCVDAEFLSESRINDIGYFYIRNKEYKKAEAIFRATTFLFPQSANAFDSYAEALGRNGKKEISVINYKKAIDLASSQKDPSLKDYLYHLKKATEAKN